MLYPEQNKVGECFDRTSLLALKFMNYLLFIAILPGIWKPTRKYFSLESTFIQQQMNKSGEMQKEVGDKYWKLFEHPSVSVFIFCTSNTLLSLFSCFLVKESRATQGANAQVGTWDCVGVNSDSVLKIPCPLRHRWCKTEIENNQSRNNLC